MGSMASTPSEDNLLASFYSKYGINSSRFVVSDNDINEFQTKYCGVNASSVTGGAEYKGGSYIGGYDEIANYANSAYSKAKEKLIRNIAEEVCKALKLPTGSRAQTAPIEDVVKGLAGVIPKMKSGQRFGPSLGKNASRQKDACRILAQAINHQYGSTLINLDAPENDICDRVSEVINSLFVGLHTEFMTVAGDVTRVLKNMQLLHDYIDASYKKQQELVNDSGDEQLRMQAANVAEVYNRLREELNRQMGIISNLINVSLGSTGKSLISLLEDNRDFTGLVRDLKADLGTSAFGDKLGYLLSGVSTVTHSAELIDKALKKLGMTVAEFRSAKNQQDLRMKIYEHIQKLNPSSKKFDELMAASEIIYKNDYNHKAVSDLLAKKGQSDFLGGDCGCMGAGKDDVLGGEDDPDDIVDEVEKLGGAIGGDADDELMDEYAKDSGLSTYWSRKSLSNKIAKKMKYRKIIFADFRKLLKTYYRNIVDAASSIAKNIGTSIPANDELDKFVKAFSNLPSLDEDKLHIALSGWAKDSTSREKRERFMNDYRLVDITLEPLTHGPNGQLFKNVQNAIRSMIKAIDNFSDKIVKSLTEIHIDRPQEIRSALKQTANSFFGSFEGGSGDDDIMGSGSFVAFERVKKEMSYFYAIANIKTNLSKVSEEITEFGDDYEQILGEEAAWLIDKIREEYSELIEKTDPETDTDDMPKAEPVDSSSLQQKIKFALRRYYTMDIHASVAEKADRQAQAKMAHKNLVTLWRLQQDAKIKMIEVAQAVDLYLRSFADGIAKNPDTIGSVVKMLDQVELVAKWFNDRSGDNLAALFEAFPAGYNELRPVYSGGDTSATLGNDGKVTLFDSRDHYYDWLENKWSDVTAINHLPALEVKSDYKSPRIAVAPGGAAVSAGGRLPGNPFLGIPMEENKANIRLESLKGLADKTIRSMRALENILSTFASVGSKLGNLDLNAKTFMSPGQIFNSLCQYISVSALTTGFDPVHRNIYSRTYHGDIEANTIASGTGDVYIPNLGAAGGPNPSECYRGQATAQGWAQDIAFEHNHGNLPNSLAGYGALTGISHLAGGVGNISGDDSSATTDAQNAANSKGYHYRIAQLRKYSAVAMSAIPNDSEHFYRYHDMSNRKIHLDSACWTDMFYDTDLLFIMTIKSIVCKVFTVVDAYRLFNRPTMDSYTHDSLNPLRQILGGAEDRAGYSYSKVIPEALELYLRLPLLMEWYREKFSFQSGRPDPTAPQNYTGDYWRLSLVPNIEGVWSNFMKIFEQSDYVTEGNYSDHQVQKIVECINEIYKLYKSRYPNATTRNIINAFVLEVNRAFGFIKQKEIDAYLDSRNQYLKTVNYLDQEEKNFLDFDILNADGQYGRAAAPSDKFISPKLKKLQRNQRNMVHLQSEIIRLRTEIDTDFRQFTADNATLKSYSFIDTLRNFRKEIDVAKSDKEQYSVVQRLIQGANKLVNLSADKIIMVHETVAAPLSALYNVYKVVAKFNALLHGVSLKNIKGWNASRSRGGAPEIKNTIEARDAYLDYLKAVYREAKDYGGINYVEMFANALVGSKPLNDVSQYNYVQIKRVAGGGDIIANTPLDASGYIKKGSGWPVSNAFPQDITQYINTEALFEDLISALLELSTNPNKLIQCNIASGGSINVDMSKLEDLCSDLLAEVKNNINKLRVEFDDYKTILGRYEDAKYPGSTRWLEENLIEILFKNRNKCGLGPAVTEHLRITLDQLCRHRTKSPTNDNDGFMSTLDNAIRGFIYYKAYPITPGNILDQMSLAGRCMTNDLTTFPFNVAPIIVDVDLRSTGQKTALQSMLAKSDFPGNKPLSAAGSLLTFLTATAKEGAELKDPWGKFAPGSINDANSSVAIPLLGFVNTDTINKWNFSDFRQKSLMFVFNNLIRQYIYDNLDEGTLKIYTPLFESFMNSVAAKEVIQNKAFPDVFNLGGVKFITNEDTRDMEKNGTFIDNYGINSIFDVRKVGAVLQSPPKETILFASNGIVMNSLINTIDVRLKKKKYSYENITEVPEYMKDKMKANLPYYSKLFQILFERADMLKKLLSNTDINKNLSSCVQVNSSPGPTTHGTVNIATEGDEISFERIRPNTADALFITQGKSTQEMTAYHTSLLTKLADLCLSIKKCCDSVYKELQDTAPYFMETSRDFINDYKSRNGVYPLMPASNVLLPQLAFNGSYATWNDSALNKLLLPVKTNGSHEFKYNYASRLLLAKSDIEPQIDHMPGAKDIYNNYSFVSQKNSMITAQEYAATVRNLVKLSRFLNDGAAYCRLLDKPIRTLYGVSWDLPVKLYMDTGYDSSSVYCSMIDPVRCIKENIIPSILAANSVSGAANAANALTNKVKDEIVAIDGNRYNNLASGNINTLMNTDDNFKDVVNKLRPLVYQSVNEINNIINLTENSNNKASKQELAETLTKIVDRKTDERKRMRVYNILDMNIVPINVHAFMREVPFANLLNYSYTFDRMIHDFVMPSYVKELALKNKLSTHSLMLKPGSIINSTRELMVKLLTYPYADFNTEEDFRGKQYYALLASLFNGNDNLKLGRPRYLSDQLWHKVLLGSSPQLVADQKRLISADHKDRYSASAPSLEAGPAAYEALRSVIKYGGPVYNNVNTMPVLQTDILDKANSYHTITNMNKVKTEVYKYLSKRPYTLNDIYNNLETKQHIEDAQNVLNILIPHKRNFLSKEANADGLDGNYLHRLVQNMVAFHGDNTLAMLFKYAGAISAADVKTTAVAGDANATVFGEGGRVGHHMNTVSEFKEITGVFSNVEKIDYTRAVAAATDIKNGSNAVTINGKLTGAAGAAGANSILSNVGISHISPNGVSGDKHVITDPFNSAVGASLVRNSLRLEQYINKQLIEIITQPPSITGNAADPTTANNLVNRLNQVKKYSAIQDIANLVDYYQTNAVTNLIGKFGGIEAKSIVGAINISSAKDQLLNLQETAVVIIEEEFKNKGGSAAATAAADTLTAIGGISSPVAMAAGTTRGDDVVKTTAFSTEAKAKGGVTVADAGGVAGTPDDTLIDPILKMLLTGSDIKNITDAKEVKTAADALVDAKVTDAAPTAGIFTWDYLRERWIESIISVLSHFLRKDLIDEKHRLDTSSPAPIAVDVANVTEANKTYWFKQADISELKNVRPALMGALSRALPVPNGYPTGSNDVVEWPLFGESAEAGSNGGAAGDKRAVIHLYDATLPILINRLLEKINLSEKVRNLLVFTIMQIMAGTANDGNGLQYALDPANNGYFNSMTNYEKYLLNKFNAIVSAGAGAATPIDVLLSGLLRAISLHNTGMLYILNDGYTFDNTPINLVLASSPNLTDGLKYYGKLGDGKMGWKVKNNNNAANMHEGSVVHCAEIGRLRFDTKFVRNLTWLVQLQRVMRVVLIDHLSWINTPVVKGLKIVDPIITEYEGNDKYEETDFDGSRYNLI